MDPDRASYLSAVEARYVTLRGRGFALSARDVARVEAWRRSGVPLRVVLRVLEDGVREFRRTWRLGEGGPRSVGYFEDAVAAAMAQRQARLCGAGAAAEAHLDAEHAARAGAADPRFQAVLAALEGAGQGEGKDEAFREALRRAWRRLRAGRDRGDDVWALTAEVDAAIVAELMAQLAPERLALLSCEADEAVARAGGARMSAQARREHHRFELEVRVRAAAGVPELLEVLLDEQAV